MGKETSILDYECMESQSSTKLMQLICLYLRIHLLYLYSTWLKNNEIIWIIAKSNLFFTDCCFHFELTKLIRKFLLTRIHFFKINLSKYRIPCSVWINLQRTVIKASNFIILNLYLFSILSAFSSVYRWT